MKRALALVEMFALYAGVPLGLMLAGAPRPTFYTALWVCMAFALAWLQEQKGFSWRGFFLGRPWPAPQRRAALVRFGLCVPLLLLATWFLAPERFLRFPYDHTRFWLLVMALYPVLSVVAQVIVFRCFFFARYEKLFAPRTLVALNALCFGLSHGPNGNWIAPVFAALGGALLAISYRQHRSLLWAVLEHAAYGNLVFTLGIGWYFVIRGG